VPSDAAVRDATKKGIRLIGYDRPGYGGSTRSPGRRVGNVAREVVAIADDLGIDRFGVWGHSGGGAPALACAALLPKRVVAAVSMAGLAPFRARGLDWTDGMGEMNVTEYKLSRSDPAAYERLTRKERLAWLKATPAQMEKAWASLISPVDRAAMDKAMGRWLVRSIRVGMARSHVGMLDDALSQTIPWGFNPSRIRVPVQVWHGGEDRFVPFAHGRWNASHVPTAEAHLLPREGHVSLLKHLPEIHGWLVSQF
jgi:pimeloyl-ACP methyl ester carboxylesterase